MYNGQGIRKDNVRIRIMNNIINLITKSIGSVTVPGWVMSIKITQEKSVDIINKQSFNVCHDVNRELGNGMVN